MHGIGRTAPTYSYPIGGRPVNSQSSSSASSGSASSSASSSSSSSGRLSLAIVDLRTKADAILTTLQKLQNAESVEKYLSTLDPLYRFTALRIRAGELSPTDAIINEATIRPVIVRDKFGVQKKIELPSAVKDFIIAGLVTDKEARKLRPKMTSRSLDNLRHPALEELYLKGLLAFSEGITLSAQDVRELSRPDAQEMLRTHSLETLLS